MMAKHKKPEAESEATREPQVVRGNFNREVARSQNFVSFYSNDVQLQTSPWDVRITFSEMWVDRDSDENGNKAAHVTEVGEVRLSPMLAKRVMLILAAQIQNYEERFGPIPQPED
jgi:hypothetical protein